MSDDRRGFPHTSVYRERGRRTWTLKWYCKELGIAGKKRGFTTRRVVDQVAARKSEEIERLKHGLTTARELRFAENARRPIFDILDEWTKTRRASGITVKQVEEIDAKVRRLIVLMDAARIEDLTEQATRLAIGKLRDEEGLGLRTCNHYLKALKQFARHLSRKAAFDDEIRWIELYNAETDVRCKRRALTDDEIARLLAAAKNGADYHEGAVTITGEQRELLYRLALRTGLRAKELRALKPESFHLDHRNLFGPAPYLTVTANVSKHRRLDEQSIPLDLAQRLREYLKSRMPGVPIFRVPVKTHEMIAHDFAQANPPVEYETTEGQADFHALRHTFATQLGRVVHNPKVLTTVLRHADLRTSQRYMHIVANDERAAIESLPPLDVQTHAQAKAATGTHDAKPATPANADQSADPRTCAYPRLTAPNCAGASTSTAAHPEKKNEESAEKPAFSDFASADHRLGLRNRRLKVRVLQGALNSPEKIQSESTPPETAAPARGPTEGPTSAAAPDAAQDKLDLERLRSVYQQLQLLFGGGDAARASDEEGGKR